MTTITLYENACAVIKSEENITLIKDGEEVDTGANQYAICRCGKSKSYPKCDGSHKNDPTT